MFFLSNTLHAQVTEAWAKLLDGTANYSSDKDTVTGLAVDKLGNVIVSGSTEFNVYRGQMMVIKYNPNGDTLWTRKFIGPGFTWGKSNAMQVDTSGNIYITGFTWGNSSSGDFTTIKYNPDGDTLWQAYYDDADGNIDEATAIALDDSANVYVTGWSTIGGNSPDNLDFYTIKYNSAGDVQWTAVYNSIDGLADSPCCIAVDDEHNVYVTGKSNGSTTGNDYLTLKYDISGNLKWHKRYSFAPGIENDIPTGLAVDGSGNVYVSGMSRDTVSFFDYTDYAIVKYDSLGNEIWVKRWDGPNGASDEPHAMIMDSDTNLYITGVTRNIIPQNWGNFGTIKVSLDSALLWENIEGQGSQEDNAWDIAKDHKGLLYVTGSVNGNFGTYIYDLSGNYLWFQPKYTATNDMSLKAVADDNGNFYVSGIKNNPNASDFYTIKY